MALQERNQNNDIENQVVITINVNDTYGNYGEYLLRLYYN